MVKYVRPQFTERSERNPSINSGLRPELVEGRKLLAELTPTPIGWKKTYVFQLVWGQIHTYHPPRRMMCSFDEKPEYR